MVELSSKLHQLVSQESDAIVAAYRHFHANPELSFVEAKTAAKVKNELESYGIEVHQVAENGLIGVLRTNKSGKTIALRADMDALPVTEQTGLSFASTTQGVMHACGHDGHTAVLLGVAKTLSSLRAELQGIVLFCFQGAEERSGGAMPILEWFSHNIKPDQVIAVHFWADLPQDHISLVSGGRMAAGDPFVITIKGSGGHGSRPDLVADVMRTTAAIINQITSLPVNRLSLLEPVVVHIGKIEAGTAWNIYPEKAIIYGGVRSLSEMARTKIKTLLPEVVALVAKANGTVAMCEFLGGTPVVHNDTVAIERAKAVNAKTTKFVLNDFMPIMASENFGEFLLRYEGFMAFVGVQEEGVANPPTQHQPTFKLAEPMLPKTAEFLGQYVLEFLLGNE